MSRFVRLIFSSLLIFTVACQSAPLPQTAAPATQAPAASLAATAAPAAAAPIPLKDALDTLTPKAVWTNFYNLTQVPRPSHHEEQATAFVAQFGRELGLETIVDAGGNVLIRKPATSGYEDRSGVVLQAHLDMVPQKTADKVHDFETDPIDAYVQGDWVKADRTTLGGDDGIGVAIIMTLLQDDQIVHGPLEAVFTTNEEDGFDGVNALSPAVLRGRYFINVDWETEGSFAIGSAGGVYVDATEKYLEDAAPADLVGYRLTVSGLQGGHSGIDINKGRGSASKLLVRALWSAAPLGVRVSTLSGGDRSNAIPREATADVSVPAAQASEFEQFIKAYAAILKNEYAAVEPTLAVSATPIDLPANVMSVEAQRAFLSAIYGVIVGPQRMSDSVPGLVETSDSMGILKAGAGEWSVNFYIRSAVDSARDDTAQKIIAVLQLAGAEAAARGPYSGWRPNIQSPLLKLLQGVYKEEFGTDADLVAVHAGLETSVVGAKYPSMDMISLGPTLIDVHSPDERLQISTVPKVYDLLVATLKQIPAK